MVYSRDIKQQAITLRKQGFSLNNIRKQLQIAKSTASIWVSSITVSSDKKKLILSNALYARQETIKKKKIEQEKSLKKFGMKTVRSVRLSKELARIYCALLWWCEGNKNENFVRFTNSDPTLIRSFLVLFRKGFSLNENKFHALVHLHSYHEDEKQKKFWSKITSIPEHQFYKSFQKRNNGKRQHKDYQGCIAVTYYDVKIAKELEAIYNAFTLISGGVR